MLSESPKKLIENPNYNLQLQNYILEHIEDYMRLTLALNKSLKIKETLDDKFNLNNFNLAPENLSEIFGKEFGYRCLAPTVAENAAK